MKLLYADEVNVERDSTDFFIYGGVIIPDDKAAELSKRVDTIRAGCGYRPEDLLKFNTRERAAHITADKHKEAKKLVMEAAANCGVKLLTSFISHKIALSPTEARRREINRVCYHFNCHLTRTNEHGLVLIDTFQDQQLTKILQEKFSVGLRGMPYTQAYRLDRILGFHLSSIGSSNFCSIVDIAMGALRYAINSRGVPESIPVIKVLLDQLSPLFIRRTHDNKIDGISLFFSPKVIKASIYLEEYLKLVDFFKQFGLDPIEVPTNTRTY